MSDTPRDPELLRLGEEMIRLRFNVDSSHFGAVFQDISVPDYLILSRLVSAMKMQDSEEKIYLSEISKEMELPMSRVSSVVQNLQNKGYVYWEHDSKGTYIYLSEIGIVVMRNQQEALETFIGNVIDRMGKDEFVACLDQLNRLEEVMALEVSRMAADQEKARQDSEAVD